MSDPEADTRNPPAGAEPGIPAAAPPRLAVVAIVGRPNVGKSSLFNRLLGKNEALVEGRAGLTRDRRYGLCTWRGRTFYVADTGGIGADDAEGIAAQVSRQARIAAQEADLVLLVVDGRAGLVPADREVAEIVRRSGRPAMLVVNKLDRADLEAAAAEFYALGLGDPVPVSAAAGRGAGDLLDRIAERLPPTQPQEAGPAVRVAVVGRPNVGKSSLVNAVLGEERVVVSPEAGTTRDPVDTPLEFEGQRLVLVDTAGLRRPGRREDPVERWSVARALAALKRCEVAVVLLEASAGILDQDKRVAAQARDRGCGLVLAVNKWDQIPEAERQRAAASWKQAIRRALPGLSYAPVWFVSARTRYQVEGLLRLVLAVAERHRTRVPTGRLNAAIAAAVAAHQPPSDRGRPLKVYYAVQTQTQPPTIRLYVNHPQALHFSYQRYIENRLREVFDLEGTPLRLEAVARSR